MWTLTLYCFQRKGIKQSTFEGLLLNLSNLKFQIAHDPLNVLHLAVTLILKHCPAKVWENLFFYFVRVVVKCIGNLIAHS